MSICDGVKEQYNIRPVNTDNPDFKVGIGQLTFDWEGGEDYRIFSRYPHVPDGSSGVTIGRGFDFKYRIIDSAFKKLRASKIDKNIADAYSKAGIEKANNNEEKYGQAACTFINNNIANLPIIEPRQQKLLFEIEFPVIIADIVRLSYSPNNINYFGIIDWNRLNTDLRNLLIDLRFQGLYSTAKTEGNRLIVKYETEDLYLQNTIVDANIEPDEQLKKFKYYIREQDKLKKYDERYKRRVEHLAKIDRIYLSNRPENRLETTILEWEKKTDDIYKPRLSFGYGTEGYYGIVLGSGYFLGKRNYFYGNSDKYKIDKDEVEKQLKYCGLTDHDQNIINVCRGAVGLTNNNAKEYISSNYAALNSIPRSVLDTLSSLIFPCHEYGVIFECDKLENIKVHGAVNWVTLNEKIKTIVIDMNVAGHFKESIDYLQPHMAENDLAKFTKAIKGWKEWLWFSTNEAAKNYWQSRFEARIGHLTDIFETEPSYEFIPIIHSGKIIIPGDNDEALFNIKDNKYDFPILEPISTALTQTNTIIKLEGIVPRPIQLSTEVIESTRKITDIFFPVLTSPGIIKDAWTENTTSEVSILVPSGELEKIYEGKGMRFRYLKRNQSAYSYIPILERKNKNILVLAEPINLNDLGSSEFQIDGQLILANNNISLSGLLGNKLPEIKILVSSPMSGENRIDISQYSHIDKGIYQIPVMMQILIPSTKTNLSSERDEIEYQKLSIYLNLKLTKSAGEWRLSSDELYMLFPGTSDEQVIDFELFTLIFPQRPWSAVQIPNKGNCDAKLNLQTREVTFTTQGGTGAKLYFPGGLKKKDDGTFAEGEAEKRFLCELFPKRLEKNGEEYYLKLGKGISLNARVKNVPVVFKHNNKSFQLAPKANEEGIAGEIFIVDNIIRAAAISASFPVPGMKNYWADVYIKAFKRELDNPPVIQITTQFKNAANKPLVDMTIPWLRIQINIIAIELQWVKNDWNITATINDSAISFKSDASFFYDIPALKNLAAIKITELNLLTLHQDPDISIDIPVSLKLENDINFGLVDDLFTCSINDISIHSNFRDTLRLVSKSASIAVKSTGSFEAKVEVGAVDQNGKKMDAFEIKLEDGKIKLYVHSPLAISLKLGEVNFKGSMGWVNKDTTSYFFASGTVVLPGLNEFSALVKIGSLIKEGGERAPNIVIYGATDFEMELFSGVVTKKLGCGIGINNRLSVIGDKPNVTKILDNLDSLDPKDVNSWHEVTKDGLYISIVGSVILASQRGGNTTINAYVAELIVSFDTDMKAIAAGRVWFFSSVAFAEANRKNPALVGAIALTPKEKRIEASLRTEKNSKMESKDALLEKILNSASVQMSFRLTPDIADYYLEEVRYEAKLIGINMIYQGSYRFAITRSAVLLKAKQLIMGHYNQSLRGGMGGIDFDASLNVRIEFAGLFLPDGVMAYGVLDADVRIRASAFIEIGFRKKIFGRKISWVKRFSANVSTSVRFYGKAALISKSNECGFDGHVEISVPICGHHLSLDAGLAYKPEIINEVITEVTRFEQDLNTIGQTDVRYINYKKISLLSENLKINNFLPALKNTSSSEIIETWYHYVNEKTQANLIMPSISAPWFTPEYEGIDDVKYKFINSVTQFEIETEDGQIYILLTSYEKHAGYEQLLADKFEQQRALFLESASEPNTLDSNYLSLVEVYSDPRINTRSREYLIDEDQLLPEHALSFEFKKIEELMDAKHGSLNRVELQNIKKLEEIKAKYARVKMHSHDNQEKEDETKQSRAALMKMLLDDLNNPLASGLFAENIKLENNKNVGLIFNSAFIGNKKIKTVKLKRKPKDGPEFDVKVTLINQPVPEVSDNSRHNIHADKSSINKISIFDIRQKYYQSNKVNSLTAEGLSKIVVKLPIAFDHAYVKGDEFSDLGYFQIYRKLPGQEQEELIADRVYPNIKVFEDTMAKFDLQYLDTNKPYIDVRSFVGGNIEKMETQAALLIINKNNITSYESIYIKGIKEESHLKNYDNSDEKQFLLDFIDPLNMKNKTVKDLNEISATDDLYNANFAKADNLTVCVNPQKHIIIDPFLYTDEYMVDKNNKIYIQKENKGQKVLEETLIIPDFSEIEYSIKRVSQADNVKVLNDIKYDKPLRLHVPSTKESMDNLAIVFSVDDLLAVSESNKKFQIIKIENNSFSVVPDNTKLQIWVKELPLQQSGYYGGEQESYLKAFSKKETHLDKMSVSLSKESTEGKIQLSFKWSKIDLCYVFENSSTIFRIGYGYQFYIQDSSMKNLSAHKMQHFLVKQYPKDWHPDLKIRYVEQIEWIDSESIRFLRQSDFFTNKFFDETGKKNYIDANFNCGDLLTGGVELYFVDSDNPGLISKQTIQIMEESLFKRSEKSFSAQANWKQMAKLDNTHHKVSANLNSSGAEIFTYYFNTEMTQILIDIIKAFTNATKVFEKKDYDWKRDLLPELVALKITIEKFKASPLNIRHPEVLKSILKIETMCALLLIGASPKNGLTEVISDIHKFSDEINKNANNITDENKFIDVTFARELIGILKRRISIANELFSLKLNNIPEYDLFKNTRTEAMPKNIRWNEIKTDADKALTNYPLTKLIFDKFGESLLNLTKKEFNKLYLFENIEKSANQIGKVVPLAQTLVDLIDKIEKTHHVEKILHHSLATEVREANGGIIAPAAVSLNSFLPDATKAEKNLEKDAQAPGLNHIDFAKAFIGYFNLLDYLGFAVDISLVNTDQQRLNQEDIIEEIKKNIDSNILQQNAVIILKPKSVTCSRRTDKSVGYSFVKIAIIPKDLLAAFIDNTPIKDDQDDQDDQDDKVEKFKIEEWLNFRGVKVNTTTEIKKKDLEILNKITSYVLVLINEDKLNEIELQPADNRWFTLPAVAGKSETSWQVPDEYGHRYKVAVRSISRYEPLILWKNNVIVANETTEGLVEENWQTVEVKPIYPGGKQSFTSIIPIYNIPNEQVVKFLYTLPLDIVHSLKNQIPSIRSGYKGISIEFQYELIDRPGGRAYHTIINSMTKKELRITKQPYFNDTPLEFVQLPEEKVNLDSYQRVIQLRDLPYYNRYFIRPTANYENESELSATPKDLPLVAATLEPSLIRSYEPKIKNDEVPIGQTHVDYEFTIFLSKNRDFTTESSLKTPADIEFVHIDKTIFPSSMLPDLLTDYIIYWKLDNYYIQFASVRLPWSEQHSKKVIAGFNESQPVVKDLYPSLTILKQGNNPNIQENVIEDNVEIHYYTKTSSTSTAAKDTQQITENYWYYVTFKIRVPFEINVFTPGRGQFYLRAVRKGIQSKAFEFDTTGVIDPKLAVPPDIVSNPPAGE